MRSGTSSFSLADCSVGSYIWLSIVAYIIVLSFSVIVKVLTYVNIVYGLSKLEDYKEKPVKLIDQQFQQKRNIADGRQNRTSHSTEPTYSF